jgi:hypothetical protein
MALEFLKEHRAACLITYIGCMIAFKCWFSVESGALQGNLHIETYGVGVGFEIPLWVYMKILEYAFACMGSKNMYLVCSHSIVFSQDPVFSSCCSR